MVLLVPFSISICVPSHIHYESLSSRDRLLHQIIKWRTFSAPNRFLFSLHSRGEINPFISSFFLSTPLEDVLPSPFGDKERRQRLPGWCIREPDSITSGEDNSIFKSNESRKFKRLLTTWNVTVFHLLWLTGSTEQAKETVTLTYDVITFNDYESINSSLEHWFLKVKTQMKSHEALFPIVETHPVSSPAYFFNDSLRIFKNETIDVTSVFEM